MGTTKSAQRAREIDARLLEKGVKHYVASIQLAPLEKHHVVAATKADAIEAAGKLNNLSRHGRRALVYAITNEGCSVHIECDAGPQAA